MRYRNLSGVLLICIFFSCKKNDCVVRSIGITHLETEYGCLNTKYTLVVKLINTCTIVSDKQAYDTVVFGDCHPAIDFTKYDLLIGSQSLINMNDSITYDLSTICPYEELELKVGFKQSSLTGPDAVVYHALIPKLTASDILTIKLKIN